MAEAWKMTMRRRLLGAMAVAALFLFLSSTAKADEYAVQKLWAPYWTVEPGFQSTLEMKNNRAETPLTVEMPV